VKDAIERAVEVDEVRDVVLDELEKWMACEVGQILQSTGD
jgi:hypothetical protein